ncbi:MAG: peptidylprolyl isomerase [Candidatus Aminicenantes bacterium]|nr:peptidylprolyl isomerase [Candidatus Aminicenantes bacterium]
MKLIGQTIMAILFCGFGFLGFCGDNPQVIIRTELGDITVEVFEQKAPITAGNFLEYVDKGLFNDCSFYRTVTMDNQPDNDIKIEVIQGGLGADEGERRLPPITHETTEKTGILHQDGTISLGRLDPGTACSEFFICVGDQPELDFGGRRNPDGQGFSAFGRVVEGMDIVRKIQMQPAKGQSLDPQIKIFSIERIQEGASLLLLFGLLTGYSDKNNST